MIRASIIGNKLVGPFKVEDGVKIDSAGYTQFLENSLMSWIKKKSAAFKKNMVSTQDNSPSHTSKFTREWLVKKGIKEDHLMLIGDCSASYKCRIQQFGNSKRGLCKIQKELDIVRERMIAGIELQYLQADQRTETYRIIAI